jgi:predicted P-loop ATPase
MGSNFLKQMVQRITHPGCQADLVLCLEGEQGTRKSSSLRILGGEFFAENVTSVDSKDDMIVFAGNILVEFSEGAVLGKASIAKLKSVITTTVDKFRPPYERGLVSFPRGCVFSLSTNDTAYLKDETGGRRFLIVKLGKVADTSWLQENRNQLFAEALYRVENGETAYEFTDVSAEMLKDLQESRTEDTAYDELVVDWYLGRSRKMQDEGITVMDAYTGAINTGGNSKEMPQQLEWRLRGILRRALYLDNRVMPRDENGKRSRRYVPTAKTMAKFKLGNLHSVDGIDEFVNYSSPDREPQEDEEAAA